MSREKNKKASKQLGGSAGFFLTKNRETKKISLAKATQNATQKQEGIEKIFHETKQHKHYRWLVVIGLNQGITTEQLANHGLKSNNPHDVSLHLNEQLIKLGWVIAKFPTMGRFKSWSWHLLPVTRALKLGLDKRQQRKILTLMEAANDQ